VTAKPTCALCGKRVLVREEAWVSHRYGPTVHLDCTRDLGKGWYSKLLADRNA
jgi:hypothetical protein